MNKPCLAAVGLLALSAVAASAAEDAAVAATRAVARTQIWKAMTAGRAGSAAVAVMENGAIVYAEGFGMADREKGEPVGQDTVFNIASISKLYAATAIMLLVDDGKVKLDDPVTTHLPEFTMSDERFKAITIRMLLNHASGLPGTVGFDTSGFKHNAGYNRDTLDILARSRLKHRPGEANLYCNDGFTLAEMIVAKVSKMSYMDFLGQRIFTPLALKHTGMSVGAQPEKDADVARVYTPEGRVLPFEAVSPLGAGGLSATAADLCRFADSFTSGGRHILSDASLAEMRKVQPADISGRLKNPLFPYGLGSDFAEIHELKA